MIHRVAINGYGRIGQSVLRALYENGYRDNIQVVAINELSDIDTIAYLTQYDSTHGHFKGEVKTLSHDQLCVNGDRIHICREAVPANLPWKSMDIDLVLECTGAFSEREDANAHLEAGARRVLFSQPAASDVDKTVVFGINEGSLKKHDRIVSNASCTTNCVTPVIKTLNDKFGVLFGTMTTIHSAMNDQPVIDAYHHHDLRRTRSAMNNLVPVNTELGKGIDRILPELSGCFTAMAVRVPTMNVSAIDLTVQLKQSVTAGDVNTLFKAASLNGLKGVLGYTEEPLASSDFNHDRRSGIIDGSQTLVSGGKLLKVFAWFDNEWGFANRMLDVSRHWLNLEN